MSGDESDGDTESSRSEPLRQPQASSASATVRTPDTGADPANPAAQEGLTDAPAVAATTLRRRRRPASARTAASSGGALSAASSAPDTTPLSAPPPASVYRNPAFVPFPDADAPPRANAPVHADCSRSASGSHRSASGDARGLAALEALRDRLDAWRTSPIPPLPEMVVSSGLAQVSSRPARPTSQSTVPPGAGGSIGPLAIPGSRSVSFLDTEPGGSVGAAAAASATGGDRGEGATGDAGATQLEVLELLRQPASRDGRGGTAWQKIPELLIKYGGPGQLTGHQDVWSDDGEPEEMDAPPLRPGAHSPTAGVRHMSQAVLQAQESRVVRQASAGLSLRGAASVASTSLAGDYGDDADEDPWLKVQQMSKAVTPVADLAKRLAHLRSRRG